VSGHRGWIGVSAGPARCSLVGGGALLLVRVRLFDEGGEDPQPDVFCDLRPGEARDLARELLAAVEDAELRTLNAGYRSWKAGS
jgi:hypothetical protein